MCLYIYKYAYIYIYDIKGELQTHLSHVLRLYVTFICLLLNIILYYVFILSQLSQFLYSFNRIVLSYSQYFEAIGKVLSRKPQMRACSILLMATVCCSIIGGIKTQKNLRWSSIRRLKPFSRRLTTTRVNVTVQQKTQSQRIMSVSRSVFMLTGNLKYFKM